MLTICSEHLKYNDPDVLIWTLRVLGASCLVWCAPPAHTPAARRIISSNSNILVFSQLAAR